MKKKKIITSSVIVALIAQLCFTMTSSAMQVGGQVTFSGTPMQTQGGTTYDNRTNTNAIPTTASAYSDVWADWNSSDIYREWVPYEVIDTASQPWMPDPTINTDGSDRFGYSPINDRGFFPEIHNYSLPIGTLADQVRCWKDRFGNNRDAYTMFNEDSLLFNSINNNNVRKIGAKEFFYGPTDGRAKFRLGDQEFDTLSEMYKAASETERAIIKNLIETAFRQTGLEDKINIIFDTLDMLVNSSTSTIEEGIRRKNSMGMLFYLLDMLQNGSAEEKRAFMEYWNELHGIENDPDNLPFVQGADGNFYMNPNFLDGADPDILYSIWDTYNQWKEANTGVNPNVGAVNFSNEIVDGGVYDTTIVQDRFALAEYIINAYKNMGAETIDVTRIVDYRITSLWVGTTSEKDPTGRYIWTVEKQDSDGLYTMINQYSGNTPEDLAKQGINFSFRPTSAGRYRITCYPQYNVKTTNRIALYATEYAVIQDTKTVVFSDQYFEHSPNDRYISFDENMVSEVVGPIWNEGLNSTIDENTPLYINDAAQLWTIDVTDAMVGKDIINLENGTICNDFDTERIK